MANVTFQDPILEGGNFTVKAKQSTVPKYESALSAAQAVEDLPIIRLQLNLLKYEGGARSNFEQIFKAPFNDASLDVLYGALSLAPDITVSLGGYQINVFVDDILLMSYTVPAGDSAPNGAIPIPPCFTANSDIWEEHNLRIVLSFEKIVSLKIFDKRAVTTTKPYETITVDFNDRPAMSTIDVLMNDIHSDTVSKEHGTLSTPSFNTYGDFSNYGAQVFITDGTNVATDEGDIVSLDINELSAATNASTAIVPYAWNHKQIHLGLAAAINYGQKKISIFNGSLDIATALLASGFQWYSYLGEDWSSEPETSLYTIITQANLTLTPTPVLSFDEGTRKLSWTSTDYADRYELYKDGELYATVDGSGNKIT